MDILSWSLRHTDTREALSDARLNGKDQGFILLKLSLKIDTFLHWPLFSTICIFFSRVLTLFVLPYNISNL